MRIVCRRSVYHRLSLACLLSGISTAAPVFAAERTWISSTSRFFHDTGAWSGGVVPGSGDSARFNLDAAYSVLFVTSPVNQFATFTNGTVSFDLGNQTYTLSSTTSPLVVGTLNLFTTLDAHLSLTSEGGTLQTQSTSIGNVRGPGTVSVGSAVWNSAGTLTVGSGGVGSVIVNAGGAVTTAGTLTVGGGGAGSVNINAGGFVFTPNAVLGSASGGSGFITIGSGGSFTAMGGSFSGGGVTFDIGGSGNGTIQVNSGGFLNCGSFNSTMNLGRDAGSRGTITLSGGSWSTVLSTAGGIVNVGLSGSGTINASSGTISCRVLQLAVNSGAVGNLNISGSAVVTTTGVGVGGTAGPGSVAGGAGQVTVTGGTLNGGQMWLWPAGTITLNGGNLSVTNIFLDGGVFNWTSGLYAQAGQVTIAPDGMFPTLALSSTRALQAPSLLVGDVSGAGTVSITNSICTTPINIYQGAVTVDHAQAALTAIGSGSMTVSSGTLVLNGETDVYGGSSVSLSLSHMSDASSFGTLTVGIGSAGTFLMTAGSVGSFLSLDLRVDDYALIDASTFISTSVGTATIGETGHGTLDVQNGSTFQTGNAQIGRSAGSAGTVNITGAGTSWTLGDANGGAGTLIVGKSGAGSLNITGSAHVGGVNGSIGQSAGSNGSVFVDTSGLSIQQNLYVGEAGTGSLTISGGGSLQCGHGYVGRTGNGIGTVILTGAGSSWTGSAGLDIGGGQSGWFTLSPGAMLSPGGNLTVNVNGVFDYAGGSLGTSTLVLNSGRIRGSGTFAYPVSNTNGSLEVNSSTLTFTSGLTNAGSSTLTKIGVGAADIGSFISAGSGTVVVSGGMLRIGSDISPSTAVVNQPQAVLNFGATQHLAAVNITSGRANMLAGGSHILVTGSINLASSATLDLNDNDFQYNYTGFSPYSTITGWIISGRNGGTWDGPGITSSTAAAQLVHPTTIGVLEGFQYHSLYGSSATFDGQDVFNSSLLLKYTLAGDANFDDAVNSLDFTMLASNFNSSGRGWFAGDFNYDGVVNALDFNAIATNFGSTLPSPPLGSLVPEPSLVVALVGAWASHRRRRA